MMHFTFIMIFKTGPDFKGKYSEKMIKCIQEWMMEDEGDMGIPQFVTDNISWWYHVDPNKIYCTMLQRDNKSLASAVLDHRDKYH